MLLAIVKDILRSSVFLHKPSGDVGYAIQHGLRQFVFLEGAGVILVRTRCSHLVMPIVLTAIEQGQDAFCMSARLTVRTVS
jgi:hypothetical protein